MSEATPPTNDHGTGLNFDFSTVDDGVVLIVDDEESVADLHTYRVSKTYTTHTAYDGEEALDKMDKHDVDVVLLDRRMPGMTGDEVIEEIQERGYDVRVVMVTAVEPEGDLLELECDGYLKKPVSKNELRDVVKHQLRVERRDEVSRVIQRLEEKRKTFESEKTSVELDGYEPYQKVALAIEELEDSRDKLTEKIKADR